MAPRPRSHRKRHWPDHLYERDGYYSWRDPATGKEHGLGRDQQRAFREAREANALRYTDRQPLVARLTQDGRTWAAWLTEYQQELDGRALAYNTRKSYRSLGKLAGALIPAETGIRSITALMLRDALRGIEDKPRTAQALRSFLKDCFRAAVEAGWLDESPARWTRTAPVTVKRSRLSADVFLAVYESRIPAWLRVAMALGMVTAQRREDLALAQLQDFRDGAWWVTQQKTGNRVAIPLELRLDFLELSVGDVAAMARQTGVLSRHLVHHTDRRKGVRLGDPVHVDRITKTFTAAVGRLNLDWQGKNPPTFHEIRSLSERLYSRQGNVNTQDLLGHRDPRMTAAYHDSRGSEWVRVRVG